MRRAESVMSVNTRVSGTVSGNAGMSHDTVVFKLFTDVLGPTGDKQLPANLTCSTLTYNGFPHGKAS